MRNFELYLEKRVITTIHEDFFEFETQTSKNRKNMTK
jgi:hypothetical protein